MSGRTSEPVVRSQVVRVKKKKDCEIGCRCKGWAVVEYYPICKRSCAAAVKSTDEFVGGDASCAEAVVERREFLEG